MKENEWQRLAMTCEKCKQTGVETLFLPCHHLVACKECTSNMENCNLQCEDTGHSSDLRHVVRICVFSELWLSKTATNSRHVDSLQTMHLVTFHCDKYNYYVGVPVVLKYILRSRNVDTRIILLMILYSMTYSCIIWCVMFWIEYLELTNKALKLFYFELMQ